MTYEFVRTASGMAGLIIFISLFAAVLVYTFKPGNKRKFDAASHIPLQADPDGIAQEDSHGR
jgi:cytochrome c oxidase cbb3-type subunit 4